MCEVMSAGSNSLGLDTASMSLGPDVNAGAGQPFGASASDSFAILDSLLNSAGPSLTSLTARSPPSLGVQSSRPINGVIPSDS